MHVKKYIFRTEKHFRMPRIEVGDFLTGNTASMQDAMFTFSAARKSASSVSQSLLRRYVRAAYAASNVAIMAAAACALAGRRRVPCAPPPAPAVPGVYPWNFATSLSRQGLTPETTSP